MRLIKLALSGVGMAALAACSGGGEQPEAQPSTEAASDAGAAQAPAVAADHVRGALTAMTDASLTVQTYDGQSVDVPTGNDTAYAWVVPATLADVKDGDFIGTATTGPKDALRAVEVVIFPESMRGSGEGHYEWDTPGVMAASGGGSGESSAMTNGTVRQQSAMTNGTVQQQSAMTNGTVTNATSAGNAGKALTIAYEGGTAEVAVPEGTPIVRFEPADRSILKAGQKLFIKKPANAAAAQFVAVGKDGLTPPM